MKKLLIFTFLMASFVFVVPTAEAKTTNSISSSSAITQPRFWRGRRTVTTTSRLVRVGNRLYRDTYRITYFRNGRVDRRLISRIRIR